MESSHNQESNSSSDFQKQLDRQRAIDKRWSELPDGQCTVHDYSPCLCQWKLSVAYVDKNL